jgi:hypothetical protein
MSDETEKAIRDLVDNAEEITLAPVAPDRQESARRDQAGRRNLSQTDVMIQLAGEAAPFHAPDGTGFVDVDINDHRETWPIRSQRCRDWLGQRFFEETDRAANPETLRAALDWLDAKAKYKGSERKVHVRVARQGSWATPFTLSM